MSSRYEKTMFNAAARAGAPARGYAPSSSSTARVSAGASRHFSGGAAAGPDGVPNVPYFVHGEKKYSKTKDFFDVHDPATGKIIARTPLMLKSEMQEAVDSSREAQKAWREIGVSVRARHMHRFEQVIKENEVELARILTEEQGKTTADAMGEWTGRT